MKTFAIPAAIVAALSISACTQPDGSTAIGRAGSPAWVATASAEAKRAHYGQTCAGYGFAPGTDAFAQCMLTVSQLSAERARRSLDTLAEDLRPKPSVTCTTFGNMTTCQ